MFINIINVMGKINPLQLCLIQNNQSTTYYLKNINQDIINGFIV